MKPETNVKTMPYKGGDTIKASPIKDHQSGNPTTLRKGK